MDDLQLGAKIRSYRKEQGLSMQTLADLVNITPSMLSQIERDLANPSINTLKLLSNALNIPLFRFFTNDNSQEDYIVRKENRKHLLEHSDGCSCNYELLTPNSNGNIEFMLQHFNPGGNSGGIVQTHVGEEVDYILFGQLTLTIGTSDYVLNEGDSARLPSMIPHSWANNSTEDAALLFALTPPCF